MKTDVHTNRSRSRSLPGRQSGAVLIVSLVMLLLLTIIGMSAVDMTTLDTRISANTKDKALAFDAAEAALNTAGNALMPGKPLPDASTPGFLTSAKADNWWQAENETWWTTNGEMITNYAGRANATAGIGYVIEQPVQIAAGGAGQKVTDLTMGPPKAVTRLYRVTARGEGPGGTEVHVQSVYARKVYPGQQ
ncbi:pilus assembly PilX family protein [Marinobacter halotolerans]|uniref:pilus assembly PilX family protein n=1 Tax=Marinobacter halotolerans TaxID=1569211 RepID=UPI0012453074|nr:PilX N-terminal domain-containing pilus assembly protein [Marinobacter halotolerans]